MTDHDILFIPGPVEVLPELREIMSMPMVGHRSPDFCAEVESICRNLQTLFQTESNTLFETGAATALMEAGIRNLVADRILHLACGAFSERWIDVSTACGRSPEMLTVEWGHANTADALRAKLRTSEPFEAVVITHNETSTGVANPLAELAAVIREESPDTLIMVDAVTSLAGVELRFDEWGLDFAFAGTQKCLALPPGICVYAVSQRALQRARQMPGRGLLLDFPRAADALAAGRTPATPCIPLVFALSAQLSRIVDETVEGRWARHLAMRDMTAEWAAEHGFEYFPPTAYRSPTVSTLRSGDHDVLQLLARAKDAGFVIGNGFGRLKGETFRIGHLGDHQPEQLRALLDALA